MKGSLLAGIVALLIWEGVARSGLYPIRLFPPPTEVWPALMEMARTGELWEDLQDSGRRWFLGFFLGAVAGLVFGVFTGRQAWLRSSLGALLNALAAIPKVVLIPVAILWFGIGELQKVLLVAWGALFPIWISTQEGTRLIEREYLWAAKSLDLRGGALVRHVLIPNAFPSIATGIRIAIANATFSLAAAEMAGAFTGIVHRIFYSHQMFQTSRMFAGVFLITVFSGGLNGLFGFVIRKLAPWMREPGVS